MVRVTIYFDFRINIVETVVEKSHFQVVLLNVIPHKSKQISTKKLVFFFSQVS